MKITNKYDYPKALVNIANLNNEPHNESNSFSATTLLKGVKEIVLETRHFDEIEMDVSDMTWTIFGTAVHSLAEKETSEEDGTSEMKVSYTLSKKELEKMGFQDVPYKVKITGRCDLYNEHTMLLQDYKTATTWKFIYNDFDDWTRQGLIYTWLLRKNGKVVSKVRFNALLKDWSQGDYERSRMKGDYYPAHPITDFVFYPLESALESIEHFIFRKIKSILSVLIKNIPDDDIEPCDKEERWESPTKYAVMKNGRKTAVKLFENKEEAEELIKTDEKALFLETRIGVPKKCISYCIAHDYCSFYKNYKKGIK